MLQKINWSAISPDESEKLKNELVEVWESQGFGCSPIKVARELGSKRRETVWSLSIVGVGYLRGLVLSTRGPG